jgi:hypothetical protein
MSGMRAIGIGSCGIGLSRAPMVISRQDSVTIARDRPFSVQRMRIWPT